MRAQAAMMESIRNFLQLRNTPNTRVREGAEESRVPGGKEEEDRGDMHKGLK